MVSKQSSLRFALLLMIAASLTFSALFLTACSGSAPPQRPLYDGLNGVILSFPQSNTLRQFQDDTFTIALRLENDGASDVSPRNPGYLYASYDHAAFTFLDLNLDNTHPKYGWVPSVPFNMTGRSQYVPMGELKFAEFMFRANNLTANRQSMKVPITFQACYPYNTTFITNLCIERDVYNAQAVKSCTGGTLTSVSQGAPVAITKVEPRYLRVQGPNGVGVMIQPVLQITIENKQDGLLVWKNKTDESSELTCALDSLTRERYGRALVSGTISNVPLNCATPFGSTTSSDAPATYADGSTPVDTNDFSLDGLASAAAASAAKAAGASAASALTASTDPKAGLARFDKKTATILCKADPIAVGSNYAAPLQIQVQYFYISSLTAQVEVVR